MNFIKSYYEDWDHPFWIKDVQSALNEELKNEYPYQLIRHIMKNDLMLSFKRWASRSNIFDHDKVFLLRKLFWIKFAQELNSDILLANCDECSITRDTKQNYTWSRINSNKETKNVVFSQSLSLILTIFSNGCWFLMLSSSSTNSLTFSYYLYKINNWVAANEFFKHKNMILTMDNWPYHKSKITSNFMRTLNWKVYFLPVYSPSLAPIELAFAYIKKLLLKEWKGKTLNLKKKLVNSHIVKEMKSLTKQKVIKIFKNFYLEITKNIKSY